MIKDRSGQTVYGLEGQNKLLEKLYGTSLGRCAISFLISPAITKLGGKFMSSKLSTKIIPSFIKKNHIDMSQYEEKDYVSYNDFFTRMIKAGERPFSNDENILISPADSKLTAYKINEDTVVEIKNTKYNMQDLLQDSELAKEYDQGWCLIFRLAVDDYHRYSYIDDGIILKNKYIPGVFHTVNPIANDYYPIFKTNCREYTLIDTMHFGKIIQMEVGAMMVGKIVNHKYVQVLKGQEKGYFEFGGSTVVVFIKKNIIELDEDIIKNSSQNIETRVLLGETIGRRLEV